MMSLVWTRLFQMTQAEFYAERSLDLSPDDGGIVLHMARLLSSRGDYDGALELAEHAVQVSPRISDAWLTLALVLMRLNQFARARECCLSGLKISPQDRELNITLAHAQLECGNISECIGLLRRMMLEHGDDVQICGQLCNALNYDHTADPAFVRQVHLAFGRTLSRRRPDRLAARALKPGKRLRVGIISPDFKRHSCAFFIEPFFEHHDRDAIELYAYHTNLASDEITGRLKKHAAAWRHEWRISDQQLAEKIRADGIDIAIELSGHTRGDSLVAMHLKPAPVQVTYLGYPNITGVDAIDARIVDSITDPPENEDTSRTGERLIRIDPCFLCFRPPDDLPELVPPGAAEGWTPSRDTGHITFGSCNALQKLNDSVLATWARVLGAVPGSRLLIKASNLREEPLRDELISRLGALGIDKSRVDVLGPVTRSEHLPTYRAIDIALDTFPYNGTTTTCDALMMGVPVVNMLGNVHASRVSASLCAACGRAEWTGRTIDEYVQIAVGLAADQTQRARLRTTLRGDALGGVLCDGPAFARRFEAALKRLAELQGGTV
jgi:predicted O-linked N-acetylglucosamine transferase (SPINDLY family)